MPGKYRKTLLIVFLLMFPSFLHAIQEFGISDEVKDHIRTRVDSRESFGIVAGTVDVRGKKFFSYGKKSMNGDEYVDENTIFEIGSVSKVFTSLLLAVMIEEGKLKLDDPIENYLPENVKTPARKGKMIAFEDLATHFSGLPFIPTNYSLDDGPDYSAEELYEFLSAYKLTRDIGSKFEYSGMGVGMLGHILSLIEERDLGQLLEEKIFIPLNMNSTGINLSSDLKNRLSKGHMDKMEVPPCSIPSIFSGAGLMRSTGEDLLKFLEANTGLGKTALWKAMDFCHRPRRSLDESDKIGLCWFIEKINGEEYIYHAGNTPGFGSFCGFSKKKRTGVVVLSNSHPSVSDIGFHILTAGNYELKKIEGNPHR